MKDHYRGIVNLLRTKAPDFASFEEMVLLLKNTNIEDVEIINQVVAELACDTKQQIIDVCDSVAVNMVAEIRMCRKLVIRMSSIFLMACFIIFFFGRGREHDARPCCRALFLPCSYFFLFFDPVTLDHLIPAVIRVHIACVVVHGSPFAPGPQHFARAPSGPWSFTSCSANQSFKPGPFSFIDNIVASPFT